MEILPAQRLELLLEFIDDKGTVNIIDLTNKFNVSKPTILRDLKELEKQNLIIRIHGGAKSKKLKGTRFEPRHVIKEQEAILEKEEIAELAVKHIQPGETILLDSGTTTLQLAKKLAAQCTEKTTVITNDIKNAMVLSENDHIDIVVIGGQKRKGVYSLNGPFAEDMLGQLNVDKIFLGTDAIDTEKGLTNSNIDETNIKKTMIKIANEIILLADDRKFNQVAFSSVAGIDALDRIITNKPLSDTEMQDYKKAGISIDTPSHKN